MASEKPTGRIVSSRYHRCIDIYISNISLNKFYELLAVFLARLGEKRQQTAVWNTCLEFGAYFFGFSRFTSSAD